MKGARYVLDLHYIKSVSSGSYYIGYTSDLEKRIKSHNSNRTKSIKNKGPLILVYSEEYETREEAYKRERQLKKYQGGNAFKRLVDR